MLRPSGGRRLRTVDAHRATVGEVDDAVVALAMNSGLSAATILDIVAKCSFASLVATIDICGTRRARSVPQTARLVAASEDRPAAWPDQ
jgi:hypothetical protein